MREAAVAMARKNTTLGERIREAREHHGWKQKQLAARVNVEPMTVSRWERGVNQPDIDTLRVIATVTQLPLAFFVEEPERQMSNEERLSRLEEQVGDVHELLLEVLAEIRTRGLPPPGSTRFLTGESRRASSTP